MPTRMHSVCVCVCVLCACARTHVCVRIPRSCTPVLRTGAAAPSLVCTNERTLYAAPCRRTHSNEQLLPAVGRALHRGACCAGRRVCPCTPSCCQPSTGAVHGRRQPTRCAGTPARRVCTPLFFVHTLWMRAVDVRVLQDEIFHVRQARAFCDGHWGTLPAQRRAPRAPVARASSQAAVFT